MILSSDDFLKAHEAVHRTVIQLQLLLGQIKVNLIRTQDRNFSFHWDKQRMIQDNNPFPEVSLTLQVFQEPTIATPRGHGTGAGAGLWVY